MPKTTFPVILSSAIGFSIVRSVVRPLKDRHSLSSGTAKRRAEKTSTSSVGQGPPGRMARVGPKHREKPEPQASVRRERRSIETSDMTLGAVQ